jgi:putative ABC transport system ATP-binding protein
VSPPVVEARGVTRTFPMPAGPVVAVRDLDVTIAPGELVSICGPSGCGKSTLLHIFGCVDAPSQGQMLVDGVDVGTLGDAERSAIRLSKIGFVFQRFFLLPMLTAAENVVLPLKLAGVKPDMAWVEQVTTSVGLANRLSHRPSELSGGQQQRVAVARALVSRPTVMFADEPTGNLDSTTSGEILGLLRTSVDELGQTTVMVTHDAHAAAIADRVLFLADGHIVRDLPRSSAHKILETLEEVSGR